MNNENWEVEERWLYLEKNPYQEHWERPGESVSGNARFALHKRNYEAI